MKGFFLSLTIMIGAMTFTPQKAEAGIITVAASGGTTLGLLFIGSGAVLGTIGTVKAINSSGMYDISGIGSILLGGTILVLDSDNLKPIQKNFSSIPQYIFDEIEVMTNSKRTEENSNDEIIFSQVEVDDLFQTLDNSSEVSQVEELRTLLTTKGSNL